MFLMQCLFFAAVVVWSICRHFRHFCKHRWLSKTPSCKNFNEGLCSGYFRTLETSCLMNDSFFHIFVYAVLEQLGIGGSSRVVTVIGWCMLDHCNSCVVLNSPCELLSTERLGIGGSSQVFLSVSWSPEPSGSCIQSFSSTSYRKACCLR